MFLECKNRRDSGERRVSPRRKRARSKKRGQPKEIVHRIVRDLFKTIDALDHARRSLDRS